LILLPGCYVTHAKLMDLGSGEILGSEDGKVRIRFASGDRAFLHDRVIEHLTVTTVAPVLPLKAARRAVKRKTEATATAPSVALKKASERR
jgi:hypothetical protein